MFAMTYQCNNVNVAARYYDGTLDRAEQIAELINSLFQEDGEDPVATFELGTVYNTPMDFLVEQYTGHYVLFSPGEWFVFVPSTHDMLFLTDETFQHMFSPLRGAYDEA